MAVGVVVLVRVRVFYQLRALVVALLVRVCVCVFFQIRALVALVGGGQ